MNTKNPQTLNRYSYVLNSPYKYTDPLGLLPSSANSTGCSAEFSSCDDNGRGIGIDDYSYRIHQTMVARQEAQQAFSRGDTETGWRIIRESEGALMALDQNGNVLEDPNQPTITVEASTIPPEDSPFIVLLKQMEGLPGTNGAAALTSYDEDGAKGGGNCTIGWGHLLNSGPCSGENIGRTWTLEKAELQLSIDIFEAWSNVASIIKKGKLNVDQGYAVIMLAFNLPGKSLRIAPKLTAALSNPNLQNRDAVIRKEWSGINKSKGVEINGLTNRRNAELKVFFEGKYEMW